MQGASNSLVFHRPNAQDKEKLDQLNTIFQPYADTTYGTLLAWWNMYDDLAITYINENAIIRSSYPSQGSTLAYMIVGAYRPDDTLQQLFDYLRSIRVAPVAQFIPEYFVTALTNKSKLLVTPEKDIAEYILSADEQSALTGKHFHNIRRRIGNFKRNYPFTETRQIHLDTETPLILEALSRWQPLTNNDPEAEENDIIKRSLVIHHDIDLQCFGVFVDNKLVSFLLYKLLPKNNANLNHLKADYQLPGVFFYTIHRLAQYLHTQGVHFLNIEQDLGIDGLRTIKQLLQPVAILEKYTIHELPQESSTVL